MTTETQPEPTPCWWTPEGFATGVPPRSYLELDETGDWLKILKQAGYELFTSYGGQFDCLQTDIYEHSSDKHLLVQISDMNTSLSFFFVSAKDCAAFFTIWWPQFIRDAALVRQAEAISAMATTLTAFVRHGHGTDTIDQYGTYSRDDRLDYLNRKREEAALKAKAVPH